MRSPALIPWMKCGEGADSATSAVRVWDSNTNDREAFYQLKLRSPLTSGR